MACISILGLIHVTWMPAHFWVNCANGEVPVLRGQNMQSGPGCADWGQRAAFSWHFVDGFLAQETQQATGLLTVPQHPIPDSFVWFLLPKALFCQGSPTPLFSWMTDVLGAPILLLSSSAVVCSPCVLWWVWWCLSGCEILFSASLWKKKKKIHGGSVLSLQRTVVHHDGELWEEILFLEHENAG